MLHIKNIFDNDISKIFEINNNITNEVKGENTPRSKRKNEYRKELESDKKQIVENVKAKLSKVELYFVGISFVVLTGLITNQIYSSSLFAIMSSELSWISFFIGHIFTIASFMLLLLFSKELTKSFLLDKNLEINHMKLVVPSILIPIFSQINSGAINLADSGFMQVGLSSIFVGAILVKYIIFDLISLQTRLLPILSYHKEPVKYHIELDVSNL